MTDAQSWQLRPVTISNRGDLEEIDLGDEKYWMHSNWYWHQQALEHPDVHFRLVHLEGEDTAVGLVAFGRSFTDEALQQAVPSAYEVIHLGLDVRVRGRGLGRRVAEAVIGMMWAEPDCLEIVVAHHHDNLGSRAFFSHLGFQPTERQNYDGDPLLVLRAR
jgi:RimJ/RimL family protein N-acetyltransferase